MEQKADKNKENYGKEKVNVMVSISFTCNRIAVVRRKSRRQSTHCHKTMSRFHDDNLKAVTISVYYDVIIKPLCPHVRGKISVSEFIKIVI